MPSGWICRSRTDGIVPEEPGIVLQYDLVPDEVALKDVAKLLDAALDGTTVRIVTRSPAVREALHQWSNENRAVIVYEDEFRVAAGDGLSAEYVLDLHRA